MDMAAFMMMREGGGMTRMRGRSQTYSTDKYFSPKALNFSIKEGRTITGDPTAIPVITCLPCASIPLIDFVLTHCPWLLVHVILRQWAVPHWITLRWHPMKINLKFHLLCMEVQTPSPKVLVKLWPSPYNLAPAYAVSEIDHFVIYITHHNKQKENVPSPIWSWQSPLILVQPTRMLISVPKIWVSTTMWWLREPNWLVVKDGHLMALESMDGGDTEEDEAVAHIVEVNLKQCATIGKGKQCDLGQQSYCKPRLQIIVGLPADQSFQCHLFFNLAMMMPSTLISTWLMTSMSTTISRMQMSGSVISPS